MGTAAKTEAFGRGEVLGDALLNQSVPTGQRYCAT
jgi:hypothetical protein